MEEKELYLSPINGSVKVEIYRKKIKNVHLKVFRSLTVYLSVPEQVPNDWIDNFLNQRTKWIDDQITKYKKSSGYNNLLDIRNGSSTQFLGKDMRILKEASLQNHVEVDEKKVVVYLRKTDDEDMLQRTFTMWWRETARTLFQKETDLCFDRVFKKYGIDRPILCIKKMKTLWGSCTPNKCKITLNEYLLKADIRCIQYVILHELTHLLYPNHSKDFYDFLTVQMPDWKERKKQLDMDVVQGL